MRALILMLAMMVPAWAHAVTRYVSTTGATTNCTTMQNINTPASSIAAGLTCTASGDTLYIRAGTYNERILTAVSGGGEGSRTVIAGYPGETVTLLPLSDAQQGVLYAPAGATYITFQNLVVDGTHVTLGASNTGSGGSHSHLKFIGIESKNNVSGGAGFFLSGTFNEISGPNCKIHDNRLSGYAPPQAPYGVYMDGQDNTIDGCEIYNNSGYGVHGYDGNFYNQSRNTVKNSYIHDNGTTNQGNCSGAPCQVAGILLTTGSANRAINNKIINNYAGIDIGSTCASGCAVYNNTIYGNTTGPGLKTSATSSVIQNNIVVSNPANNIQNDGSSNTFSSNLCFGPGGTANCAITQDPLFVDSANNNFHLQAGSPAIGIDLSAIFTTDFDNTTRTVPWSSGAYVAGAVAVACPGINPALVASYAFEDSGNDSTGNLHTANFGIGWSYTGGKYGRGVVSTGASGITVADHDALDMCGGFTYEGWISLPDINGDYVFINKNPDSKSYLFASLQAYCGSVGSARPVGGYSQYPAVAAACYGTPLTTGVFQHMAVTYDSTLTSGNVKLYINGNLVTSADGTTLLDATTGTLQFCTSSFNETCPSGTIIDEIQIYNYARTAQQIVNDMNGAIAVGVPTELIISGGTRRIGPGTTLRYGLKK